MTTYTLLRFLHILAVMWFVAGILGRQMVMAVASRTGDLRQFATLAQAGGRFEQRMVAPGNLVTIVFGVLLALDGNWPIFGFLEGSDEKNWLLVSNIILIANLLAVALFFMPRERAFERTLKEALATDASVDSVKAQFDEPLVRWARYAEFVALLAILYLMTFKPF